MRQTRGIRAFSGLAQAGWHEAGNRPLLHLQNPIDQISVACLIRKCQGRLQPIPLQLGPTRQSWTQVFINQELQGAAAQPR
ncbi:MAG: hypothetical protein RLZZ263_1520 [Cyanobacteriota bacterium]